MHTSPTDNRIVRIKLENDALVTSSEQVLLSRHPAQQVPRRRPAALRPGRQALRQHRRRAERRQRAERRRASTARCCGSTPTAPCPSDNPFGNYVWSYGHRNPQGLAFDSQGRLWEQEFGNAVMDETNLITKGGNYGWPACEGTSGTCGTAGFIAPKHTYPTAEGSCSGIAIVRDVLYVACERGTRLYREVISGTSLTDVQVFFNGTYGRLRTVEPAPDGGLWLTTSNARRQGQHPEQQQRADPARDAGRLRSVRSCCGSSAASRRAARRSGRPPRRARRASRPRRCGRPRSTSTRSEPITVDSRCAMTTDVRSASRVCRPSCTSASPGTSSELVASSRMSSAGSARNARANDTSWRCPADSRTPRLSTSVSYPSGIDAMRSCTPTARAAASISARRRARACRARCSRRPSRRTGTPPGSP